ncbi:unnamed protein product, partial [Vitis vinifera]
MRVHNLFNESLTFSRAPISSNVTSMSDGGVASARSLFSNSFSVTTSLSDIFKFLDSFSIAWGVPICEETVW